MASMALNRPTDTSHARAFTGTPSRGHCTKAAAKASCSASSARSKSRRSRIKVASTRRDSVRYASSTWARASSPVWVIAGFSPAGRVGRAPYHSHPPAHRLAEQAFGRSHPPQPRAAKQLLPAASFGAAETLHRPYFTASNAGGGEMSGDSDRVVQVSDVDSEKSAELLFGFSKWAVGRRSFSSPDSDGRGSFNRMEGRCGDELSLLLQVITEGHGFVGE